MHLVTYTTPSHAEMCERFVVSRGELAGFDGGLLHEDDQVCESGSFNMPGFVEQTWRKVAMLASLEVGRSYCYVDADCVVFPGLADWCRSWVHSNENSIGHGDDILQLCMGTLVWRQTKESAAWFKYVYDSAIMLGRHDQEAVQILREIGRNFPVELKRMNGQVFANHASRPNRDNKPWKPGLDLHIPEQTLCWHANFCIGVDNKMLMLEKVLQQIESKTCVA